MKIFKQLAKEITVQYKTVNEIHKAKITSSRDSAEYLRSVYPIDIGHREAFLCLFLNRANNTIGHSLISIGGISGTVADGKVIFQHALSCSASAIILCHNHPSGNLEPSQSDINLTKKMKEFGSFIDMPILDHVILTEDDYYSFADYGIL